MFVNDDIYYSLSDMTENEKRKEGDYLMTCFVIHVSLLSLHIFFRNSCFTKACRLPPTYKFEFGISWFSINHRNIDNHFSYEKVSCLKWVLRKRRYTENLLLKYVVRRVILYLLARVLGKERVSRSSQVHVYYMNETKNIVKTFKI